MQIFGRLDGVLSGSAASRNWKQQQTIFISSSKFPKKPTKLCLAWFWRWMWLGKLSWQLKLDKSFVIYGNWWLYGQKPGAQSKLDETSSCPKKPPVSGHVIEEKYLPSYFYFCRPNSTREKWHTWGTFIVQPIQRFFLLLDDVALFFTEGFYFDEMARFQVRFFWDAGMLK